MADFSFPSDFNGFRVHFVGIKGTGMAALVEIIKKRGAVITGSDVSERFYTDEILEKLGVHALPFSEKNITRDIRLVIYSSAYNPKTNPDLTQAARFNIPCITYAEALGALSAQSYSAGVSGVHGKTSTTGIVGTILKELPLACQVLAGSRIASFGDSCTFTSAQFNTKNAANRTANGRNYFVAETCEYRRNFMFFHPQIILLTSVESDHEDYYPTYESIRSAFVDYICKLPKNGALVFCADDKGAAEAARLAHKKRGDILLIPYGEAAEGDYHLSYGKIESGAQHFSVGFLGSVFMRVPGKHEALDACGAAALVAELLKAAGKNPRDYAGNIKTGIANFRGGARRSEVLGEASVNGNSVIFIDDYGHHPTAIKTTLAGYRDFYAARKIIVDFMSHTYSRTAALLDDFASAFDSADIVIFNKIYASARENAENAHVTGRTLFEATQKNHQNVYYFEEPLDAKDFVLSELGKNPGADFPNGFLFVTMGAGDNWKLGRALFDEVRT